MAAPHGPPEPSSGLGGGQRIGGQPAGTFENVAAAANADALNGPLASGPAFVDARGLDREQIELLQRWYEGGSPEGNPADLPPMPRWTSGWQLGEPDLVIEPEETYVLPADGVDVFRNLIIPIPNERTRYVRTIDLRPGNPRIVPKAAPVRPKPVMTSSKISRIPYLVQIDRNRSR